MMFENSQSLRAHLRERDQCLYEEKKWMPGVGDSVSHGRFATFACDVSRLKPKPHGRVFAIWISGRRLVISSDPIMPIWVRCATSPWLFF
jgi:hypothetical protein